ncbi:TIGR02646 family protein [Cystobacter fuscus]|uniref:retron system putative HNH endonuclease n=1 Tax=Cystobacter fuscus TaxID=43 RepID=UPI002B2F59AE|nr:TIGR02646 family protein [Cystobacter fuscus]
MIPVNRGRAPGVLTRNQKKWLEELVGARTPKERKRASNRYQHHEVKDALVAAFYGKCAYCESQIRHIDYGHIEHFRPKSKYPRKTFSWANLLLACGVCNGTEYKGEKFPNKADGGPLVNPCTEDPALHFSFDYDPEAQLANVHGKTRRGLTTEKLLGLNRKELRSYRSKQSKKLWFIAQLAPSDPEARRLLEEAASVSEPYSAFATLLRNSVPTSPPTS